MKFIALKTNDGQETGKISFYCRVLEVTRQGFRDYLENRDKPWKHEALAAKMMEIIAEDEWNDTYGRERMHQALILKYPEADIPSESTVYRVMREIGLSHKPNRKPNGKVLEVTRQGFYDYLINRDKPWKYEALAAEMMDIIDEDECNDTYGRERMHQALMLKHPNGEGVPSESTVYRVMHEIGISHRPKRKPNGITKADREAMKSDDLLKRDFKADKPCEKCVTDITEIKGKDGKLYTSVIFDCFDLTPLGISMDTNMKTELCVETVKNAVKSYPELKGAILHSDRGSQYTSEKYREVLKHAGFVQSMNSAGGRCHDNARCESMWARMKEELFYSRNRKSENYTVAELKTMIWRYYMSYWKNRRICSANGGLPPAVKRKRYYESLVSAA